MSSNIESAVNLAAWLIRTGRQPPGDAVRIAAHRFGVDRHAVAQRVGARGGRRAAETRRRRAGLFSTQPFSSLSESVLAILVLRAVPSDEGMSIEGLLLDGPCANEEQWFDFPPAVNLTVTEGDRVRFLASYSSGSDGSLTVSLRQVVGVDSAPARNPS